MATTTACKLPCSCKGASRDRPPWSTSKHNKARRSILYLHGKALQRAGHKDTGSAAYHAAVQARVRGSHPSLATFELRSCFHPAKDTSMLSLTFMMPYRDIVA